MKTRQITKFGKNADVEMKIPGVSVFETTVLLNTKIGEVKNKIPDVSHLKEKNKESMTLNDKTSREIFTTADYLMPR